MREIEIAASDERLITPSGLSLVGQVLGKSDMIRKANRMRTEKRSQPQIGTGGYSAHNDWTYDTWKIRF